MIQHEELLNEGIRRLRLLLGRGTSLSRLKRKPTLDGVDAFHRLVVAGQSALDLCVAVKPTLRPSMLASIEAEAARWRDQSGCPCVLLVSTHVSEALSQRLRERGLWFVDSVGNAFVEVPGSTLIYSVGHRPLRTRASKAHWMTEQGARVLYELLACGPWIEATYRDVSESTGVSLGMISKLVSEWIGDGLLRRHGRGTYEIVNGPRWMEMWIGAFAAKLQPRILLGRYKTGTRTSFQLMLTSAREEMPLDRMTVGGEYAADLLTDEVRSTSMRLYLPEEDRGRIQRILQLSPSPEGNVELCEAFAGDIGVPQGEGEIRVAHPLLVYAELLASNNPSLGEVALRLKRKRLGWLE
jgi:hypothetical protein